MIALTMPELARILFLDKCGVTNKEIVERINENRKADEKAKVEDENFYVFCVLDQEED
jgi:phenolic acid decarboxylase